MALYSQQLDTFLCVAEKGSFSKAAEALYITPTAVIKQMNLLEGALGVELFHRSNRGLTLTAAGASFVTDARRIVSVAREATEHVRAVGEGDRRVVRVGTSIMTPATSVAQAWQQVRDSLPALSLKFVSFENTPENARSILANLGDEIDVIAGVFDEVALKNYGCHAREVTREPFCLAVPAGHRLAGCTTLDVSDLAGERLYLIRRGWNGCSDRLRAELEASPLGIEVVDFPFYCVDVFNRCEAEGALLLTIKPWSDAHPLFKTVPVNWDHAIPFGLLHAPHPSAAVCELLDAFG